MRHRQHWNNWTHEERLKERADRRAAKGRHRLLRELDGIAASIHAAAQLPRIAKVIPQTQNLVFQWARKGLDLAGLLPTRDELEAEGWQEAGHHPIYPASTLMFRFEARSESLKAKR